MNRAWRRYTFRPVQSSDFDFLAEWLKVPEVAEWYTDPEYIEDLRDHMQDDRIRMQIVLHRDRALAYVQDYDIHRFEGHHLSELPLGSRGIDTFIGCEDSFGKGHGTKYLAILAQHLFDDGVPALGVDPHPDNLAARSSYAKTGFREKGEVNTEWGKVVLMTLFASDARRPFVHGNPN